MTGTLPEDLCTFMLICRGVILKNKNIFLKTVVEKIKTHTYLMFRNVCPKIVSFMR
jgi:hypothetical protein